MERTIIIIAIFCFLRNLNSLTVLAGSPDDCTQTIDNGIVLLSFNLPADMPQTPPYHLRVEYFHHAGTRIIMTCHKEDDRTEDNCTTPNEHYEGSMLDTKARSLVLRVTNATEDLLGKYVLYGYGNDSLEPVECNLTDKALPSSKENQIGEQNTEKTDDDDPVVKVLVPFLVLGLLVVIIVAVVIVYKRRKGQSLFQNFRLPCMNQPQHDPEAVPLGIPEPSPTKLTKNDFAKITEFEIVVESDKRYLSICKLYNSSDDLKLHVGDRIPISGLAEHMRNSDYPLDTHENVQLYLQNFNGMSINVEVLRGPQNHQNGHVT